CAGCRLPPPSFAFETTLGWGHSRKERTVKYLLLIYDTEKRWESGYEKMELAEYGAFGKEFATQILGGNALKPTSTATTVRVRDGKRMTTDGPFAETKEQLGGYYLVEAADLDEALGIAAKIPAARYGSIEVRPLMIFA
ncbi:MAG TPA: YciI family protein, partial [Polyangiaceae bacterium]